MKKFKKGRDNLSATIFVPYDCTNNCKFCTSKKMYQSCARDKDEIIRKLKVLNNLDINEIVITGGEPFANMTFLSKMLDTISSDKDVYINTTLPIIYPDMDEDIYDFIKNNPKIKGINVSRHGNDFTEDRQLFSPNIFTDKMIGKLSVPVKINCVMSKNFDIETLLERWSKVKNVRLSLREDYRYVTKENLRDLNDETTQNLLNYCDYLNHGGCDVCFDIKMQYKDLLVSLHRGLELSSIELGDTIIVNDIVVKPDGNIYYDWDDKNFDIDKMLKDFSKKLTQTYTKQKPMGVRTPLPSMNTTTSYGSCGFSTGSCGSWAAPKSTPISRPVYNTCGGGSSSSC